MKLDNLLLTMSGIIVLVFILRALWSQHATILELQSSLAAQTLAVNEIDALLAAKAGSGIPNSDAAHRYGASSGTHAMKPKKPMIRPLGTPVKPGATHVPPVTAASEQFISLADRLARLETITKGALNWIRDPFIAGNNERLCQNNKEYGEHQVHSSFAYPRPRPPSYRKANGSNPNTSSLSE